MDIIVNNDNRLSRRVVNPLLLPVSFPTAPAGASLTFILSLTPKTLDQSNVDM